MRASYSLQSQEINDKLLGAYSNLIDMLGFENTNGMHYSGILEYLDASGSSMIISSLSAGITTLTFIMGARIWLSII